MAETSRVFVHIGAPKTGTTYLQQVLDLNRDRLAAAGVLYPKGLHAQGQAHHAAVWDLRGGVDDEDVDGGQGVRGKWSALVAEVRDWDGPAAVVSSEMFVFLAGPLVRRVAEAFGDRELHVVYTARDLVRQLPAVWQEQVKNRRTLPYDTFRKDALGPRKTPMAKHFWRAQDAASALAPWAELVPAERIHVVTAPPPGSPPEVLWQRFATLLGIDPDDYPSTIPATNESLGVTAAEVLRRYNERHAAGVPIQRYRVKVKQPLVPALAEGIADRNRLPLTARERSELADVAERIVTELASAGYDVVGSLDDLRPPRPPRDAGRGPLPGPEDLSDAQVVDALLDLVHHLLHRRPARPGAEVPRPPE